MKRKYFLDKIVIIIRKAIIMGVAENIKAVRTSHNMTQEEFGDIVGVSYMAVSQWETGRAIPRMGAIQRISDYFGISKGELIDGAPARPITPSTATLPLKTLGKVHAGNMDDDTITDDTPVEVPAHIVEAHPRAFVLSVEGDCMNRRIPAGAHVVVDPDAFPNVGSVVVTRDENYAYIMRKYYRGANVIVLSPDSFSDKYEDIIISGDDELTLVGVVVWYQSPEEMS